jgi:hypothetical protein
MSHHLELLLPDKMIQSYKKRLKKDYEAALYRLDSEFFFPLLCRNAFGTIQKMWS